MVGIKTFLKSKGHLVMVILSLACFSSWGQTPPSTKADDSARLAVHLLDYLAQDYGMAVSNGKILNPYEYNEQVEFMKAAADAYAKLNFSITHPTSSATSSNLKKLQSLILKKEDATQVSSLARKIQSDIIKLTDLSISPAKWPSLATGQKLFTQNCTQCHGLKGGGDGLLAQRLNPKPTNFLDTEVMKNVSPLKVFNTIRLGVPGTPMAAFLAFSDKETWDVSFYILSLRYQNNHSSKKLPPSLSLEKVSTSSDEDLYRKLDDGLKNYPVSQIRLYSNDGDNGISLDTAKTHLDQAFIDYQSKQIESARKNALIAYLEGIEPIEPRLKANDAKAVEKIEMLMANVRSAIELKKPVLEVQKTISDAHAFLVQIENILSSKAMSPWLAFLAAFGIILREGFEAILIVIALLGVIRASGQKRAAVWIHGGWVFALACGAVAWFFSGWILVLSGAGREMMEAVTSILAVIVLLYIGFWLHSKTEISKWTAFIQDRVQLALQNSQLLTLGTISFMAVFREAFETVLFLRAIWLDGTNTLKVPLLAGTLCSFIFIFVLAFVLLRFSVQIPIRKLFNVSAGVILALAVILTGKGLHSLQETGWLSITSFPMNIRSDFIGVYPTLETFLSQLVVLGFCMCLWKFTHLQNVKLAWKRAK